MASDPPSQDTVLTWKEWPEVKKKISPDELDVFACVCLCSVDELTNFIGLFCDSTSVIMYEVLDESLRRAEMNHNITYGISKFIIHVSSKMFSVIQIDPSYTYIHLSLQQYYTNV